MNDAMSLPSGVVRPGAGDERQLLRACAAGDRHAANELVERTYRKVWAALYRMTGGDQELAADLTQEAYRKAWASLSRFDGRSKLSTWLHRIAYTTFLNHVRRPRRVVPLEERVAKRAPDESLKPDAVAARAQENERLRLAVLKLPDPLRETVAARFWGDVPVRELATAHGISEVAVRKRLRKALSILKKDMEVAS